MSPTFTPGALGFLLFHSTARQGGWAGPKWVNVSSEQSARNEAGFGGWSVTPTRRRAPDLDTWRGTGPRRPMPSAPHKGEAVVAAHHHTLVMVTGLAVGGDVEQALESVGVPSYVLDTTGLVRWINPAAERLVGDVRGRHFTSVVAPEDGRVARELFSRKVLGNSAATDAIGVLVSTTGTRVPVEISAVPLRNGQRVVGVFGLLEEGPDDRIAAPHPHLTSRQAEVLRLLEQGPSTKQMAGRAPSQHGDSQKPHPPSLPSTRRQQSGL